MAILVEDAKYDWGDTVLITHYLVDGEDLSGSIGTVCGITLISNKLLSDKYGVSIGTNIYTVELSDGRSFGIPESLLSLNQMG